MSWNTSIGSRGSTWQRIERLATCRNPFLALQIRIFWKFKLFPSTVCFRHFSKCHSQYYSSYRLLRSRPSDYVNRISVPYRSPPPLPYKLHLAPDILRSLLTDTCRDPDGVISFTRPVRRFLRRQTKACTDILCPHLGKKHYYMHPVDC
jgi:hypothetical protein